MGLTGFSTGSNVLSCSYSMNKEAKLEKVVALAGNPNVGKSTVFNSLTGLNQHTGNWPGKTVVNAKGKYQYAGSNYLIVDIPGTYSLYADSTEEEIARNFICFGNPDVTVVVADATCLERNLNLLLQIMEITDKVVLCVNLMDEAKKKKIHIDLDLLSQYLGIPVVGTSARSGRGLNSLMDKVASVAENVFAGNPLHIEYSNDIENAISIVEPTLSRALDGRISSRWVSLKLIDADAALLNSLNHFLGIDLMQNLEVALSIRKAQSMLSEAGIDQSWFKDNIVAELVKTSENIAGKVITFENENYAERDRRLDKFLTSKLTGIPVMLVLLFCVFWLTITGSNYPSQLIAKGLFSLEDLLIKTFRTAPPWISSLLINGIYRTVAWVVSVMLPPMAIFFPLFTLLEDSGYLPRIAFNLDNFFRKACAHGKQSLTMCMGFGCNAAGIIGCRIIDSPRERLIAIITNNFVPCNGRFPTLIAIITMFFAGVVGGVFQSFTSTLILTVVIVLGVTMTLLISKLLSKTILKGLPSSFSLELPPYRCPQVGRVIIRSMLDRTLFVLGRAVTVAAPAGLIIWLLANTYVENISLLAHIADFLNPFAQLMGLDGYILLAFILGFPANEIVVPIIIMSYTSAGSLTDFSSLTQLHAMFLAHGWTWLTAVCVMLFSLMHWPCGTTCITIKKETQSFKWTLVSFLVPTITGIVICIIVANSIRLLSLV